MSKIFFITGVNGVGKSAIIPHLKSTLPENKFAVYDFDTRGVPSDADRKWRISETKHWINIGKKHAEEGKNTVICGFIKPSDIIEYRLASPENPDIILILLHADPDKIKQRLVNRYTINGIFDKSQKVIGKPIAEFIDGNVWFAEQIKHEFEESSHSVINTSDLTVEEVADEVVGILLEK